MNIVIQAAKPTSSKSTGQKDRTFDLDVGLKYETSTYGEKWLEKNCQN